MTWGSNATYDLIPCPYCCNPMRDDRDSGPTSHMEECPKRPIAALKKGLLHYQDRATPAATQEAVERVARAIRRYKLEQSWPTATEEELAASVDLDWECDEGEARAALASVSAPPGFVLVERDVLDQAIGAMDGAVAGLAAFGAPLPTLRSCADKLRAVRDATRVQP